jgi:hypothetical protein
MPKVTRKGQMRLRDGSLDDNHWALQMGNGDLSGFAGIDRATFDSCFPMGQEITYSEILSVNYFSEDDVHWDE